MQLNNKKILITGGANALGRHLVEFYLQQGADVISLDLAPDALLSLKSTYPGFLSIQCDISQSKEIAAAFAQIGRQYDYLDVLINNAAINHNEPLYCFYKAGDRRHHLDAWQSVLDINLTAPFEVSGFFVEQLALKGKPGVVVNICAACFGEESGQSAHAAAKAGLNALTQTWSRELKPLGIRVISISPHYIKCAHIRSSGDKQASVVNTDTDVRKLDSKEAVLQLVNLAIVNDYMSGNIIELEGGLLD